MRPERPGDDRTKTMLNMMFPRRRRSHTMDGVGIRKNETITEYKSNSNSIARKKLYWRGSEEIAWDVDGKRTFFILANIVVSSRRICGRMNDKSGASGCWAVIYVYLRVKLKRAHTEWCGCLWKHRIKKTAVYDRVLMILRLRVWMCVIEMHPRCLYVCLSDRKIYLNEAEVRNSF